MHDRGIHDLIPRASLLVVAFLCDWFGAKRVFGWAAISCAASALSSLPRSRDLSRAHLYAWRFWGYVMSILIANAMLAVADHRLSFAVTAGIAVVGSALDIAATMLSPFSFATEAELDAITARVNTLRQARGEVARLREAFLNVERKLFDAPCVRARDLDAAAARALGETNVAVATEPSVDIAELREQKEGLERRISAADETLKLAQGSLREGIHDLLRECAQRAGERYAQLAAELGQHWQMIYAVEATIGTPSKPIAPLNGWMTLKVPASEFLLAHRADLRHEWHAPTLASADRFATDPQRLSWEIADHGRRLFGEWPL